VILAVAILVAVAIGLVRGYSLQQLADLPLRWGWLALVAFGLQIYLIYFPEPQNQGLLSPQLGLLALSYALLFVFTWQNRRLPGMWIVGAGFLANLTVMLLNGGYMPITPEALAQVGHTSRATGLSTGSRIMATKDIVLPREATLAWWLSDIFVLAPPFPLPTVFSLGDVLIALGAFWLLQRGMAPASATRA
jgi:hypothetical protein